ncbi:hypothetical protein OG599_14385 [Streptomyces sp. NBC_01335]|uniref:hypothetical protein n=1 Tax=Streptomyces sp. NBC_01335 TaxID=2903828 RepID=UPI002E165428|nr:hypothetical protein OG599_14385 [Streptomyces sp. NBC_01335]
MGEEPTWLELLFAFVVTALVPTAVGLTVICSVVGLTLWARATLRRRRTAKRQPPGPAVPKAPEDLEQVS